jgi:hypothetical protein
VNDYDRMCADDHDGRKDECICDWAGLPGDFDPDPACPQHGRAEDADRCICDWHAPGPQLQPLLRQVNPSCPRHGKRPWAVCERCNYDTHSCPGCGTGLPHGQEVCHGCSTDDLPPRGLIVYEVGDNPYDLPPELFAGWSSGGMK